MGAEATKNWLASFAALEKRQDGAPAWLAELRRGALDRFAKLGFPTSKDEEWRATDLAPLTRASFELPSPARRELPVDASKLASLGKLQAIPLVFVDGRFAPEHSKLEALPQGATLTSLSQAMKQGSAILESHFADKRRTQEPAFAALNEAFFEDGALLVLPANAVLEQPVHLVFVSTGDRAAVVSHPRVLVVAGAGSQARVVESHLGVGDRYFSNAVTEIVVGPNAQVEHVRLQREQLGAFHVGRVEAKVGANARFNSFTLAQGGGLSRLDLNVTFAGEGAECSLDGLMLGDGEQQLDVHTRIEHAVPHCTSQELYKAVLGGKAHAVFNGKVKVHKDAQKTDSSQTNRNLLLSDDATVFARPQLEIYADDVKCSHGSATGQLDAEAIFYMRSRGIGEAQARAMLTEAFAAETLERVEPAPLREALQELTVSNFFGGRGKEAV